MSLPAGFTRHCRLTLPFPRPTRRRLFRVPLHHPTPAAVWPFAVVPLPPIAPNSNDGSKSIGRHLHGLGNFAAWRYRSPGAHRRRQDRGRHNRPVPDALFVRRDRQDQPATRSSRKMLSAGVGSPGGSRARQQRMQNLSGKIRGHLPVDPVPVGPLLGW